MLPSLTSTWTDEGGTPGTLELEASAGTRASFETAASATPASDDVARAPGTERSSPHAPSEITIPSIDTFRTRARIVSELAAAYRTSIAST
jgi:hypothetical protein